MAPCLKKMTIGKINQSKEGTHKTFSILGLLVTTIKKKHVFIRMRSHKGHDWLKFFNIKVDVGKSIAISSSNCC
jgi:hypothetical protein